jgi:hypothetical protein
VVERGHVGVRSHRRCVDGTEAGEDELERLSDLSVNDEKILGLAERRRDEDGGSRVAKMGRAKEEVDGDDSTLEVDERSAQLTDRVVQV